MPFYGGSFKTLEELESDYFQLKTPKIFSFAGILARICQPIERHDNGSIEVSYPTNLKYYPAVIIIPSLPSSTQYHHGPLCTNMVPYELPLYL